MEHFRAEGKKATAFVEESAKAANVEVESVLLEGNPAEKIVEFAEQNGIEMIVWDTRKNRSRQVPARKCG